MRPQDHPARRQKRAQSRRKRLPARARTRDLDEARNENPPFDWPMEAFRLSCLSKKRQIVGLAASQRSVVLGFWPSSRVLCSTAQSVLPNSRVCSPRIHRRGIPPSPPLTSSIATAAFSSGALATSFGQCLTAFGGQECDSEACCRARPPQPIDLRGPF